MKNIRIGLLDLCVPPWRDKYIPELFWKKHLFNNINFLIINDPFKESCDICFYDVYSIKYDDLKNNIFDLVKGSPIFILDSDIEQPCFPFANNSTDTFKDWTNNFKNFSVSMYKDSSTNLFLPFVNFEGIKRCINDRQKTDISIKNKFANWISSNPCNLRKSKIDFINEHYKHIDYYGNVYYNNDINNKALKIPNDTGGGILNHIHKYYKFNFAFENTPTKDYMKYITEKIEHGYCNNSIPIYWGCSNIVDYFNENSFINLCDLNENEMIEKIKLVDENDELYKDMFYAYPFKEKNVDYAQYFDEKYRDFMMNIFNMI